MKNASNIHVLVVDDEESVRESIGAFLVDYGFPTDTCRSTEEARDLMRENSYDVCVTDFRLPGLSGEDLILLASPRYPEMRFIIITGTFSSPLSKELLALGMRPEHVFHKPIRVLSLLVKCIKKLANDRNAQKTPV